TAMARLTCAATAAGAQVIVETHSDHILNGLRIAVKQGLLTPDQVALHYFRRVAGKRNEKNETVPAFVEITTPTVGPDGMLSSWPDGFFDEWDRSLDELLD
ncbi:MAG: DUF3696 domain-containing protein, partial [Streptosporangiaceae bacterium]